MRKKLISLSEIGILLVAVFAFSFLLSESVPSVSAADYETQCCELTKSNEPCSEIFDLSECADGATLTPSKCSDTSYCKLGCCIDDIEGTYDRNVPQSKCNTERENVRWEDDANCNVPGADFGCCILGDNTAYVTSQRCSRLSELRGLSIDYRGDYSEALCFARSRVNVFGACVVSSTQGNMCKFTSEQECNGLGGFFSDGFLCTAPDLETNCQPTEKTTCVEGKDEVYFLDSCGNPANIYDSSKKNDEEYWNKTFSRAESCNSISGNADSKDCGNCNRFLGGICSSASENNFDSNDGDFYCKSTDCEFDGVDYKNGESWCAYEGKIGEGDDIVGSRHWRYACTNGEVNIEPCSDYRQQVCVQSNTDLGNGEEFKSASCRINNWRQCIDLNNEPDKLQTCEDLPDCYLKKITFADSFNFDYCAPAYPEGFNLNADRGQTEICGQGTRTCVIKYKAKPFGGCECIDNCACDGGIFTEEMNDLCTSLGDCGGYVNVLGKYTSDGYKVSNAPMLGQIFIDKLIAMTNPVMGLFVDPQLEEVANQTGTVSLDLSNNLGVGAISYAATVQGVASSLGNDNSITGNAVAPITGEVVGGGITGRPIQEVGSAGWTEIIDTQTGVSTWIDKAFGVQTTINPAINSAGAIAQAQANLATSFSTLNNVPTQAVANVAEGIVSTGEGTAGAVVQNSLVSGGSEVAASQVAGGGEAVASQAGGGVGEVTATAGQQGSILGEGSSFMGVSMSPALSGFLNFGMVTMTIVSIASIITGLLGIQTSSTGMIAGGVVGATAAFAAATISYMAGGGLAGTSLAAGATFSQAVTLAFTGGLQTGGSIFTAGGLGIAGLGIGALAIGVAVAVIVMAIFGGGGLFGNKCPPKMVTYTCEPWQAPTGGGDCDKCSDDPLTPCSEYRCQSLGAACNLLNRGTEEEICVDEKPNDITPPVIEPQLDVIGNDMIYEDVEEDSFRVTSINGGCLEAYTPLVFGVTTDEPAQCKFDLEIKEFDSMAFNLGSGGYVYNHTTAFPLPDPSHGQSQGIDWDGALTLYIKCRDTHGNEHPSYYSVDMCINQGEDITAPQVRAVFPAVDSFVKYGETSKAVFVFTNEPSDCRWSSTDKDYNLMVGEMTCNNDLTQMTVYGYSCSGNVDVSSGENNFFIRCKDQPWLESTSEKNKRNSNAESFEYSLKGILNKLTIDWVKPSDNFESNTKITTILLEAKTSWGGDYHKCSYSFSGYGNMIPFFETYSEIHKQEFSLGSGSYKIYIECEDETEEKVRTETTFRISYDSSAPQIARVFQDGNMLTLTTTEDAVCKYSTDSKKKCGFSFDSAEDASSGENHRISVDSGKTYYIKCKDEFGNAPSDCSIIVRAT